MVVRMRIQNKNYSKAAAIVDISNSRFIVPVQNTKFYILK